MELFRGNCQLVSEFPLINAVINQEQSGHVFSDGLNNFFILHKAGFSELILQNFSSFRMDAFVKFVHDDQRIPQYIHIYKADSHTIEPFDLDNRFNIKLRDRVQLRYTKVNIEDLRFELPEGYEVIQLTDSQFDRMGVFELKIDEVFWNSTSHFFKSGGYGVFITNELNEPVSICYSACVSNGVSEIDVKTMENFRGLDLANKVTKAFLKQSIERDIQANWDCFVDNIASLKTAKKNNFEPIMTYNFLSIYNTSK